jgi:HSP20 family protein
MWNEFNRACKPGRYSSVGGFFWPGGGFYMGPGGPKDWEEMMKKWEQQQKQGVQSDTSNMSRDTGGNLPIDVIEDELRYTLFADVPGLNKPDLSIRLSKDNVLTISGERKVVSEEGVLSQERPVGPFKRQWTLPEDADSAAISAKVTDGVLSITVGKKVKEPEPEPEPDTEIPWLE